MDQLNTNYVLTGENFLLKLPERCQPVRIGTNECCVLTAFVRFSLFVWMLATYVFKAAKYAFSWILLLSLVQCFLLTIVSWFACKLRWAARKNSFSIQQLTVYIPFFGSRDISPILIWIGWAAFSVILNGSPFAGSSPSYRTMRPVHSQGWSPWESLNHLAPIWG